MPFRIAIPTGLLVAALLLGCGGGEPADGSASAKPSGMQIATAVLKKLLSNSVEARPEEPAPAEPPPAPTQTPAPPAADLALGADAPGSCPIPYKGPVTIIPVRTAASINRALADRGRSELVYETDDTAIWDDGRVMTTNMEDVGTHLNAVGWSSNPMTIAGAGQRPGGSRGNLGWNSATTSFQDTKASEKRKQKRTRRRG